MDTKPIVSNLEIGEINWKWSKNDVLKLHPNIEPKHTNGQYRFFNVKINQNFVADIYYSFDSGIVKEVYYRVYGKTSLFKYNKNSLPSFIEKVSYFQSINNNLLNKGFKCDRGWHFPNSKNIFDYGPLGVFVDNCDLRKDVITKVFNEFERNVVTPPNNYYGIGFTMENYEPSINVSVRVRFDEYYHYNNYNLEHIKIGGVPGETTHRGVKYREWFSLDFSKRYI